MKRIWILLCVFIMVIGLSIPSAYADSPYITNFSLSFTSGPPPTLENVDIVVTQGEIRTTSASGAFSGLNTGTVTKRVLIQTGTYAGWSYEIATWTDAGYTGTWYVVSNNTGQWWGMTTGDIHAIGRGTNNPSSPSTWNIISINGQQASGIVNMLHQGTTPGTSTTYNNIELQIYDGWSWSGTASGYYSGPMQVTGTNIYLPLFDESFSFGPYLNNAGNGTYYGIDLPSGSNHTGIALLEGSFTGLGQHVYPGPIINGTMSSGTIEHVLNIGGASPTPVGYNPAWLIATLMSLIGAGGFLLRKRMVRK